MAVKITSATTAASYRISATDAASEATTATKTTYLLRITARCSIIGIRLSKRRDEAFSRLPRDRRSNLPLILKSRDQTAPADRPILSIILAAKRAYWAEVQYSRFAESSRLQRRRPTRGSRTFLIETIVLSSNFAQFQKGLNHACEHSTCTSIAQCRCFADADGDAFELLAANGNLSA